VVCNRFGVLARPDSLRLRHDADLCDYTLEIAGLFPALNLNYPSMKNERNSSPDASNRVTLLRWAQGAESV